MPLLHTTKRGGFKEGVTQRSSPASLEFFSRPPLAAGSLHRPSDEFRIFGGYNIQIQIYKMNTRIQYISVYPVGFYHIKLKF